MSHHVRPNPTNALHTLIFEALVLQKVARPCHRYNTWETLTGAISCYRDTVRHNLISVSETSSMVRLARARLTSKFPSSVVAY